MSKIITEAVKILEAMNLQSVLVGYSGGKESRCVLDLCCKLIPEVVPFHMYFLPNLPLMLSNLKWMEDKYKLKCLLYPGKIIINSIRSSLYRMPKPEFAEIRRIKSSEIYRIISLDTGIKYVALGLRSADSMSRRRLIARQKDKTDNMVYPLQGWTKYDVFAYLKANNIPIPASSGTATSDISLMHEAILWLHDAFPEDYKIVQKMFPDIQAHIERREHYGTGSYYNKYGPIKTQRKT